MSDISFPRGDFDVTPRFLGRYTIWDIPRILAPCLAAVAVLGPFGIVPGGVIGLVLAEARVGGQPLDQLLRTYLDYRFDQSVDGWPPVEVVDGEAVATDTGRLVGFVRVGSVQAETMVNVDAVNALFKRLRYPVKLVSSQRRVSMKKYATPVRSTVLTDHYAIVSVSADDVGEGASRSDRAALLDERCREVRTALTGADMYAERVRGEDLHSVVDRFAGGPDEVDHSEFSQDGECRRVLYVDEYPTQLPVGWLSDVLTVDCPGLVDVVQTVSPASREDFDRLELEEAKAEVEALTTSDPRRQQEMQQVRQDIHDLIRVDMDGEPVLRYGVYIVVRADGTEAVETCVDRVSSALRQVEYGEPGFEVYDAVRTVSPWFGDRLGETVMVPGVTAAAGFPWSAYDTVEESGVVFGRDREKGVPVVLDRFSWSAPHMSVMGKTGSGKTFFTKLLLVRSMNLYDDLQVLILDLKPDLEYSDVAELFGNHVIRWPVGGKTADHPDMLAASLRDMYQAGREHDGRTIAVIDEAHRVLADDEARTVLDKMIREGRSHDIAVTPVTQNTAEFTQLDEEGESMLRQIDCNVFFCHKDVEAEVESFFQLSGEESRQLRRLREGSEVNFSEALLRGPVHATIMVEAYRDETTVILSESTKERTIIRGVDRELPIDGSRQTNRGYE